MTGSMLKKVCLEHIRQRYKKTKQQYGTRKGH